MWHESDCRFMVIVVVWHIETDRDSVYPNLGSNLCFWRLWPELKTIEILKWPTTIHNLNSILSPLATSFQCASSLCMSVIEYVTTLLVQEIATKCHQKCHLKCRIIIIQSDWSSGWSVRYPSNHSNCVQKCLWSNYNFRDNDYELDTTYCRFPRRLYDTIQLWPLLQAVITAVNRNCSGKWEE